MATVDFSDVTVDVVDLVPEEPVHLRMDKLTLSATDLSSEPGQAGRATLRFDWAEAGQVQIGGAVALNPVALDLTVDIKALDLRPFQPYLSDQAGLIITQGLFSTGGRFQLSRKKTDDLPGIAYQGDVDISHFASIDRKNANDFLKWERLQFDTLDVTTNPMALSVDQIQMTDFFTRLIVDAQGNLNLMTMLDQPATPPTNTPPPTATVKVVANDRAQQHRPEIRSDQSAGRQPVFEFKPEYFGY